MKQTLQICDFLGYSKKAIGWQLCIGWQLWSALLLYVLLRFQAWMSDWPNSFTGLFTMVRSAQYGIVLIWAIPCTPMGWL